jgi:hypothetical protein
VPGVDLVPFWTLAVANVYRKAKQVQGAHEDEQKQRALTDHTLQSEKSQ